MVNACLGHSSVFLRVSVFFWDTVPFPWRFSLVVYMSAIVLLHFTVLVTVRVFLFHLAHYNLLLCWSSFLFWLFYWLGNYILRWGNDAMQILIMGHFDFLFHCLHILSTEKINLIFFLQYTLIICKELSCCLPKVHMQQNAHCLIRISYFCFTLLLLLLLHMGNRSLNISDSGFLTYTN